MYVPTLAELVRPCFIFSYLFFARSQHLSSFGRHAIRYSLCSAFSCAVYVVLIVVVEKSSSGMCLLLQRELLYLVLLVSFLLFEIMTPKAVESLSLTSPSHSSAHRRRRLDISFNQKDSFAFGVIADIQWADAPDGSNYAKTVNRCYRGAFTNLQDAVQWWSSNDQNNLQFIAQLGDLIDGLNQHKEGESERVLKLSLQELDRVSCPSVNLVGNHELYNFDRSQLAKASWLQHGNEEYYSFAPAVGWRVVVLDSYQISLIGHADDDPRRLEAAKIVQQENPNVSPDGASGDWFQGIQGYQRRFCPYNGGYGQKQLEWFQKELADAAVNEERVLVFSHVIIHPKACGGGTMAWDYDQALAMIHETKTVASDTDCVVAAVLCGHDHKGNYHCDEHGIHHCTFMSPLNKGAEGSAYGLIQITPDFMEIRGPKLDDFLPNVEGRPIIKTCPGGEGVWGPCESLKFPFQSMSRESGGTATEEEKEVIIEAV